LGQNGIFRIKKGQPPLTNKNLGNVTRTNTTTNEKHEKENKHG
jgi:hypothetical protein